MAVVTEFISAVKMICSERGIDPESVYEALESAVLAAYKREYNSEGDVVVEMNRENGDFKVIARKEVVEEAEDADLEISLKEAQEIQKGLEIGDTVEMEQVVEDFGRIAAQTAKQVIMQKIRESEKEAVLAEFSDKVGEIFTAMMQRMQGGAALFEIGKAVAVMPIDEQISNEFYRIGERYKVLLKGIEDTPRGRTLLVSRADSDFMKGLFEMEVPELESGVVEIKAIAREAGSRSKIAVTSNQEGVDPIGSFVGQRGMRIANVMSELGEEKIDIIEWREELEEFVEKALSPAKVNGVRVGDDDVIIAEVDEDQLSLAIGRDGQNVRLAAKITDTRIDIHGPEGSTNSGGSATQSDDADDVDQDEEAVDAQADEADSVETESAGTAVDAKLVNRLEKAGKSVEDVMGWSVDQLVELDGVGKVTAEKIVEALSTR